MMTFGSFGSSDSKRSRSSAACCTIALPGGDAAEGSAALTTTGKAAVSMKSSTSRRVRGSHVFGVGTPSELASDDIPHLLTSLESAPGAEREKMKCSSRRSAYASRNVAVQSVTGKKIGRVPMV